MREDVLYKSVIDEMHQLRHSINRIGYCLTQA